MKELNQEEKKCAADAQAIHERLLGAIGDSHGNVPDPDAAMVAATILLVDLYRASGYSPIDTMARVAMSITDQTINNRQLDRTSAQFIGNVLLYHARVGAALVEMLDHSIAHEAAARAASSSSATPPHASGAV